jgi:hypothetical protein
MAVVSARDPDALTVDDHWRQWEQEMLHRDARERRRRRQVSWAAASSAIVLALWLLVG